MTTYHGIARAECLHCGRVTEDRFGLEILNDQDPTFPRCGLHFIRWLLSDGSWLTTTDEDLR